MWAPGTLVECVDDRPRAYTVPGETYDYASGLGGLRRGVVYTVRETVPRYHVAKSGVGVRLDEIRRPGFDSPFDIARFRPVDESRLSIFRSLLAPSPKTEVVG